MQLMREHSWAQDELLPYVQWRRQEAVSVRASLNPRLRPMKAGPTSMQCENQELTFPDTNRTCQNRASTRQLRRSVRNEALGKFVT